MSVLVRERRTARPTAVLTGDGLFIGDVGRPDLANLGDGSTTVGATNSCGEASPNISL
jgi:hydroxyacylglutathione hydrolase